MATQPKKSTTFKDVPALRGQLGKARKEVKILEAELYTAFISLPQESCEHTILKRAHNSVTGAKDHLNDVGVYLSQA